MKIGHSIYILIFFIHKKSCRKTHIYPNFNIIRDKSYFVSTYVVLITFYRLIKLFFQKNFNGTEKALI